MGTTWARHEHGMGTTWARHAMCESAFKGIALTFFCVKILSVTMTVPDDNELIMK
jgi:hypothetical protein